ncbi:MAG: Ribosomal small subunit methyltransferase [Pseudomonadota bacterium]|jgi:16S rRNA (cytosine1402-N4)-methyltransferase
MGEAVIEALAIRPDGCYVDCTFGRGGHSRAILERLGPAGRLIAIDRDPEAVAHGSAWRDARFRIMHAAFSDFDQVLAACGVQAVDGVLLDLGVSSPQLDDPERGFSFRLAGPLDMRMDPTQGQSVRQWLLQAEEQDIAKVIAEYGEERFARPIAGAIAARVSRDGERAFATTTELAELVAGVVRRRERRAQSARDPATRTFQALRIFINRELEELTSVLARACGQLVPGGRLAVISFHSLEDRLVKQFIAHETGADAPRDAVTGARMPTSVRLRAIARIRPDAREIAVNPRSRSAILRVAERV